MRRIILTITTITILVSCSTPSSVPKRSLNVYQNYIEENKLQPIEKINAFKFQGWSVLDDQHFLLNARQSHTYLIVLRNYCPGLINTTNIALDQAIDSQLNSVFDSIFIPNNLSIKCRIERIFKVDDYHKNTIDRLN